MPFPGGPGGMPPGYPPGYPGYPGPGQGGLPPQGTPGQVPPWMQGQLPGAMPGGPGGIPPWMQGAQPMPMPTPGGPSMTNPNPGGPGPQGPMGPNGGSAMPTPGPGGMRPMPGGPSTAPGSPGMPGIPPQQAQPPQGQGGPPAWMQNQQLGSLMDAPWLREIAMNQGPEMAQFQAQRYAQQNPDTPVGRYMAQQGANKPAMVGGGGGGMQYGPGGMGGGPQVSATPMPGMGLADGRPPQASNWQTQMRQPGPGGPGSFGPQPGQGPSVQAQPPRQAGPQGGYNVGDLDPGRSQASAFLSSPSGRSGAGGRAQLPGGSPPFNPAGPSNDLPGGIQSPGPRIRPHTGGGVGASPGMEQGPVQTPNEGGGGMTNSPPFNPGSVKGPPKMNPPIYGGGGVGAKPGMEPGPVNTPGGAIKNAEKQMAMKRAANPNRVRSQKVPVR